MRKKLENYLLDVISGDKSNFMAKLVLLLLSFLEIIYIIIIKAREFFYSLGIFESNELDCRVISVGNITAGGTGKTPLVEKLARDIKAKGKRIVVISRGYRSEGDGPVVVSDGNEILTDVQTAGDEVYMLAHHLDGIPIVRGESRLEAGELAIEKFSPDIILLDDSFQHWQLERDLDIVIIDAMQPFGYNHLIPRGLLREPLSSLKRADLIIMTRTHHVSREKLSEITNTIKNYNNRARIIKSTYKPLNLEPLVACTEEEKISCPEQLENKRVLAMSGIGNPASFSRSLKRLNADIVDTLNYPDHHNYCQDDVMDIAVKAQLNEVDLVVTTDKDAVKFNKEMLTSFNKIEISLCSLGIEIQLKNCGCLADEILGLLE